MQDNSSKDQLNLPVDKGWDQMSAQLDEVMPQRRRRFTWWWLSLLLLVGFVITYAWSQLGIGVPVEHTQERQELLQAGPIAAEQEVLEPVVTERTTEEHNDLPIEIGRAHV